LDDEALVIAENASAPDQAITIAQGDISAYLPLAGLVDLDKERERLQKELTEVDSQIQRVTNLLNSPFAGKAPQQVVQKERDKLAQLQASQAEVAQRLEAI
jgi:valyl-tRNA synthetase